MSPRDPGSDRAERVEQQQAELDRLRHGLALIVREAEQFPTEDGIGAGAMARNLLNGAGR